MNIFYAHKIIKTCQLTVLRRKKLIFLDFAYVIFFSD